MKMNKEWSSSWRVFLTLWQEWAHGTLLVFTANQPVVTLQEKLFVQAMSPHPKPSVSLFRIVGHFVFENYEFYNSKNIF